MMGEVCQTPDLLRTFFSDISAQPPWRGEAAVDMAWKDNRQWTKKQLEYFRSLNMPENLFVNLMASALEAVTGYEAKHRVDWMVQAADDEHEEMAEALNHKLNDELRLADANQACSDAYESQAGIGVGWVYVGRNPDIMGRSKLLIEQVHRDEIFWDMRSRSAGLTRDCRWLARRKFFDKDEAKSLMPSCAELIDYTFSDWQNLDISEEGSSYYDWFSQLNDYSDQIDVYMDYTSSRERVAVYEVYYKVVEHKQLITLPGGLVSELNLQSVAQLEALASGQARVEANVPVTVVRVAWFIGPNIIYDGPSPHPHREFPYVPFFGIREDATNTPVGLLRRMRGPQEEYNRAAVEIQHILRSRRVEKDDDATPHMTDPQVIHEISRAEGIINKKRGSEFRVVRDWAQLDRLEGVLNRARNEINAASGIYQTFQGQTETGQSGVAVESIAQLGAQTLGKINANYQFARKMVGDLALSHIIDDIGDRREVVRIPQGLGQRRKQVHLNDGMNNRIALMRGHVALQDVHTSAGYRHHLHQRLTGVMGQLDEGTRALVLPYWIETSEMPRKEQLIKTLNERLGIIEDEEQRAAAEQAAAEEASRAKELATQKELADIENRQADTKYKESQAEENSANALKKRVDAAKVIQEIKQKGNVRAALNDQQERPLLGATSRVNSLQGASALPPSPQQAA